VTLIKWRDGYATHVAQFDEEHKKLVALINELAEAIRDRQGEAVLGHVFSELVDYVHQHFTHEEQEMERYNFPGLEEQRAAHAKLKASVFDLQARFNAGEPRVIQEVYELLRFWLIDHILEVDQKYSDFFHDKLLA
jgi:hemerythrin